MINLIPREEKKSILSDYRRRYWVLIGYLFFLALIIVIILLSSFYFAADFRFSALEKILKAEMAGSRQRDIALESQSIAEINEQLAMFKTADQLTDVPPPTLLARRLASDRPAGIKLANIDYARNPDNTARLSLRGQSPSRKSLVSYLEQLAREPLFSNVDSPVSNLIPDTGGSFTITLTAVSSLSAAKKDNQ